MQNYEARYDLLLEVLSHSTKFYASLNSALQIALFHSTMNEYQEEALLLLI